MSELTITTTGQAGNVVLSLVGDLDIATATELREHLARVVLRAGQQLVLDLAEVPFCDSSGISALLAARNHALGAGATIALAGVPAHLVSVLCVLGLLTALPHFTTVQAATAAHHERRPGRPTG